MEYLVSTNLNILNKGNEPTFVISNRKEIKYLTLGTSKIGDMVTNWHVSDEISLSDDRYQVFQLCDLEVILQPQANQFRILSGRPKGKSVGCTKSNTLGEICRAGC
jgi:hypothetical protein